jgi:uncharacterized protein with NRDE domain
MCLILFAYQHHPRYRLILAANRDEFYARPTAPLGFWSDHPQVLAGRDLEQQGTWLGVTRGGRLAAITNYRDPHAIKPSAPSRGHLVSDFLKGSMPPADYLKFISASAERYNGFNLLVGNPDELFYFSNHGGGILRLEPGLYGLSNSLLDTPWPKVAQGKQAIAALAGGDSELSLEKLFGLLQNQTPAPDEALPATGVDLEWERALSPTFITSPAYGTRSSSVLLIDTAGAVRFSERTWLPAQATPRCEDTRHFQIDPTGASDPLGGRYR